MSDNHTSPCQELREVMGDIKKHERELGGIDAKLSTILRGQEVLFTKTKELCDIAVRNESNIRVVKDKQADLEDNIGNGLKAEIAHSVVEHVKKEVGITEGMLGGTKDVKELEKRVSSLEGISWLTRGIDKGVKKWSVLSILLAMAVAFALIVGYSAARFWGHMKESKWGETPGLMQKIGKSQGVVMDKNTHYHENEDGSITVHSHENPDGPLVNEEKQKE